MPEASKVSLRTVRPIAELAMKKCGGTNCIDATAPVGVPGTNGSGMSTRNGPAQPGGPLIMRRMALPTSLTSDEAGSGKRCAGVVPPPGISRAALSAGTTMLTCSRNRSSCKFEGCGSMLLSVGARVVASWKRTPRSKPAPSIDQPRITSAMPVSATIGHRTP